MPANLENSAVATGLKIVRFHPIPKMSTIKERNGMDLTEAEDIEKKWQEHTEKLHKKDHNDPDNQQWYYHSPRTRRPGI